MIVVKSWVFRKLYELLLDKFIAELNPRYVKNKNSLKLWHETFNSKDHPFYGQNKAHTIFDINEKGDYFYEKYQLALTNPDTVPIKENRIFKALRYINDPEPWTPEKHKAYKKTSQKEINNQARILYDEFERKQIEEAAKQKERSKEKRNDDEIEKSLLQLITVDLENFMPRAISSLMHDFFEAISLKRCYTAWHSMTPRGQYLYSYSSTFDAFKRSFYNVSSFRYGLTYYIRYSFNSITFDQSYDEVGIIYDLSRVMDIAKFEENHSYHKRAREVFNKINEVYQVRNSKFDAYNLTNQQLKNPDFQRIFFSFIESPESWTEGDNYQKIIKEVKTYSRHSSAEFYCKFFEDKWLIDDLGSFSPVYYDFSDDPFENEDMYYSSEDI